MTVGQVRADLMVLTVDTLQITVCEKYVAYPGGSTYGRFFTFMNTNGGYVERAVTFTIT
jgi:hypothetical protein